MSDEKDLSRNLEPNVRGADGPFRGTITYQLKGPYSYEREEEPEIAYKRFVGYQDIDEWIEHALQLVAPYTRVRLTLEVME